DHRNTRPVAQRGDKGLRFTRLLAALAAQRQWEADDDAVDLVLRDQFREACETVDRRATLDDAERSSDRPGRVRDGNAGARPAVVERQNLHLNASAIACFPAWSASRRPSGFLPPASA